MCGITGAYAFNEIGRISLIHLGQATDALAYRGPDDRGTHLGHFCGLGHRRLSILDPTPDGHQPMWDDSGRYALIFNGEIYNFRALRQELEAKGFAFHSQTDTEVLLKGYVAWGEALLPRLNGFFAFSVYDQQEESLFIARDRMGIKPLLWYRDDDRFVFASEMKSLLAYGLPRELNYEALHLYLQLNYVPAPHSLLQGVHKLLPGHSMLLKGGEVSIKQWWQVPYDPHKLNPLKLSYEQQQERLRELMDLSVQRRLVADVPLGAFLSGGIDSSVITALAARHVPKLNTFSIGYRDEPFFDETQYARLVADKHQTEHTVFSLSNHDLYEHLQEVLDYLDEPFADSSAIPVYILSKRTKKIATVALSGDGADELFSGYNKHQAFWRTLHPGAAEAGVSALLPLWKVLPKSRSGTLSNKIRQFQRFGEGMRLPLKERYWRWATFATEGESLQLLSPQSRQQLSEALYSQYKAELLQYLPEKGGINDILYTDVQLVLPGDMLTKVDLMSMANGLEVRVPFLDHEVVQFAFSLPADSKINGQMKKRIVQDAFRDLLPPELYQRPKRGFEVPLLKWFRTDLRSKIENHWLQDAFIEEQGIFDVTATRALKQQLFSSNPGDAHARIWALIVFQDWWKRMM
ncbi:asparagine synthase (glutamine-hydrolyzing) [Cesiribacter andamanensis]|uniref:asparagine synthase (glutamine-hydrolyzing) n=1 Tax=Cesiribacter andamanensis AMV16 TaxID=1279009 RepID=M7N6G8_9BACT|nr:asparagine synthase (glutamine-hydrolyzing) [Cesiribacter andamanensis]EMR02811.1 Asparagine synthetase [glutamine-hydrolyzing] 1 [Cesiribacter andamanensis AMV16]